MRRAILTEPVDWSSRRTWALIVAVAAIGALATFAVRGLVSSANSSRPADPLAAVQSRGPGLKVLFIGNSFTSSNAMPTMVKQLAADSPGAARKVIALAYAPGGSRLSRAVHDPWLLRLLRGVHWNIVVVQEQSQLPALPYWLVNETAPALRTLTSLIRRDGARPVLFETWGYEHGDLANLPGDSYAAMQGRLRYGYAYLGGAEGIGIVPVGDAFGRALAARPSLALWADDGHHPSLEGSYLAAATFNAALDLLAPGHGPDADPDRATFTAGLDAGTAAWLRQIASDTVRQELGPVQR
jgi:hypothetical protein